MTTKAEIEEHQETIDQVKQWLRDLPPQIAVGVCTSEITYVCHQCIKDTDPKAGAKRLKLLQSVIDALPTLPLVKSWQK